MRFFKDLFRSKDSVGREAFEGPFHSEGDLLRPTLALPWLLDHLGRRYRKSGELQILDLGSASTANLEFFGRLGAKVHIADLYPSLFADGARQSKPLRLPPEQAAWQRLFPFSAGTHFDAVLAWDLLNYLSTEEMAAIAEALRHFCRPGTLLFCLVSLESRLPAVPRRFTLLDGETLRYETTATGQRIGPQYREPQLLRHLPPFRVRKTFLLRHGIQEYVFQFQPKGLAAVAEESRPEAHISVA